MVVVTMWCAFKCIQSRKRTLAYTQKDMCSIGDLYYDTSADLLGHGAIKQNGVIHSQTEVTSWA